MKIYKELEQLGLFQWLKDTHDLADNIITADYLETLNNDDVHKTVINASTFKWSRDNHNLLCYVATGFCPNREQRTKYVGYIKGLHEREASSSKNFFKQISTPCYNTYEEAEIACIIMLIENLKEKK